MNASAALASPFLREAVQLERPPHWTKFAVCAEVDPGLFFPEPHAVPWDAKRICAACPVQRLCLGDALDRNETHGVWGGLDEAERRALGPDPSDEAVEEALSHVARKTCTRCGGEKHVTRFLRKAGSYSSPCRDCQAQYDIDKRLRKAAA